MTERNVHRRRHFGPRMHELARRRCRILFANTDDRLVRRCDLPLDHDGDCAGPVAPRERRP
jgi:hypothetical protein